MLFHLEIDGARNHITRSKLSTLIMLRHETNAAQGFRQLEPAPLATHRLGDQKRLGVGVIQTRRVKLDEFHIRNAATGAPRRRNAIPGRGIRVSGVEIHLTCTTRGQNSLRSGKGVHLTIGHMECVQAAATADTACLRRTSNQIHQHVVFKHLNGGGAPNSRDQGFLHRRAGGVGGMDDTAHAVSTFTRQMQRARMLRVFAKRHTQFAQPINGMRRTVHHSLGCGQIA